MQAEAELLCSTSCCRSRSKDWNYNLPPCVPLTIYSELPDVASLSQSFIIQFSHLSLFYLSLEVQPGRLSLFPSKTTVSNEATCDGLPFQCTTNTRAYILVDDQRKEAIVDRG
jgi:hypothetical protein